MKNPPHVGDFILTEVLETLGLSLEEAARRLNVEVEALTELVEGRAPLSEEVARHIETAFGPRAEHLMRMQRAYDDARTTC